MPQNNNSDFRQSLATAETDDRYLSAKQAEIVSRFARRNGNSTRLSGLFILILLMSLTGLATFGYYQNQAKSQEIERLKNASVAGVKTTTEGPKNIISSDNFSIVLNQTTPNNFKLERKVAKSIYLENTNAVTTGFLATNSKAGQNLVSGIEVQVSEYDNKMDKNMFEDLVLSKLGERYEIKTRDVTLPKDIKITRIQQKNNTNDDEKYYVTVTEDNYYVIKYYNQSARYNEFSEITKFTESLVPNIYLN